MKISVNSLLLGILLFVSSLNPVYAKWTSVADAPTRNSYNQKIEINHDGTYVAINEVETTVLTEIGRENASNFTIHYNGDSEEIEIIEAKTVYKGKEYLLDKKLIENKPLASAPEGFDQIRQILLAFPKIEIGSKLYLKYRFTLKKPPLENFFAKTFFFGNGKLVEKAMVNIRSKLPLDVLVNDPDNSLKLTKTIDSRHLIITLEKPIYKNVFGEPGPIIINNKYLTWVSVSSINDWKTFAVRFGKLFTKNLKQKLPASFMEILNKAKQKKNPIDQINTVTSLLNDKIRYMGDWRSVNGRLIPRDLDRISKTQLGDCKDFSAITAAILNRLGLKAQIAIVVRGIRELSQNILPSFEAFNHALVKVTDKNGKVYWIDPTNFSSMAEGIFPDIANKKILVLDPKEPSYEKITPVDYKKARIHSKRELEILPDNKVIEKGSLLLEKESALDITGAALKVSENTIKDIVFDILADDSLSESGKKSMSLPKLDSRIAKDIYLDYSFEKENNILQTNAGPAIRLTYPESISTIYNILDNHVSEALIRDFPITLIRETIIKNIHAKNIKSLNVKVDTPWLYAKRECVFINNHDLKIKDHFIFYQNLIPSEDFKKPAFIKLKNWLKRNFKETVIVFEPVR